MIDAEVLDYVPPPLSDEYSEALLSDPFTTEEVARMNLPHINSDETADWLLRQYARIEAEKALVTAQAAAIQKRLDNERAALERFYQADLEQYVKNKIAGQRSKTVTFLHGTCSVRTVPGGPRVADEKAAYAWAWTYQPELIHTETISKVDKKAYLALVKEDGEVLPGIEIVPARESLSIRFETGGTK